MRIYKVLVVLVLVVMATPSDAWLQSLWKPLEQSGKDLGARILGEAKKFGASVIKTVVSHTHQMACHEVCPRVCDDHIGRWLCPFVCKPVCPKMPSHPSTKPADMLARVKRSLVQGQHYDGHLVPLTNKFAAYDLNDDGVVSLQEMAATSGSDVTEHGFRKAFTLSDVDGNGVLTPKELYNGPFVFEKDVGESDYLYCKYTVSHKKVKVNRAEVTKTIKQIPRKRANNS